MELKQAMALRFRCGYLDFCINYSKDDTKRNGLLDYQVLENPMTEHNSSPKTNLIHEADSGN